MQLLLLCFACSVWYLVMLVELATEGNSEVPGCSAGDGVGGVQGFAAVVGAPALTDLHVLETRLHTGGSRVTAFQLITSTLIEIIEHVHKSWSYKLTGSCEGNP